MPFEAYPLNTAAPTATPGALPAPVPSPSGPALPPVSLLRQAVQDRPAATAACGTALTQDQVRLLGEYADEVVLCYDSDEAGQKATARAIELFSAFGKNVYTALATVNGNAVGMVATRPEGLCRVCVDKAARLVRLCDAFSIPVVTVVNSEGFVPSASEDEAGGIRAASRLAGTYADATTAKVALLAGKAVGPVYTALASADLRLAVAGCTVSALDPMAAARVLYKEELEASNNLAAATAARAAQYAAEECSAQAAVAAGAADLVVDAAGARAALVNALDILASKRAQRLPKKHGNMAL